MQYSFALTDTADEEIRKAIVAPLAAYNESMAGPSQYRPLVISVRDADQAIVGGLWGATGYGWLFTQLLVVPSSLRNAGIGTRLMLQAEQEAVKRGCHSAWLDTHEFQAKGFYEKLGYAVFGELPNYPHGFSRIFLKKALQPAA